MLGLGIVLTYRASGVVNFAHAALGMYVAYAYFEMRETGDLALPILGLPDRVHVIDAPTVFTALTAALLLAAVMGLLEYVLVFRPLRTAPPLARLIGSLGLLLYLQETARLRFQRAGAASFRLESLLPKGSVHVLGVVVPSNRFVLAAFATCVAAALWAVFRFTRFGLATRAAAENEKGALLLGHSPDRLASVNWVVAAILAGVSVVLITGVEHGIDPASTSLRVVPALAAALLGGLSSFWLTLLAGLGLGMLQSALLTFEGRALWLPEWLPQGGLQQALPVLLIILAITLRGARLPTRDALVDRRLPASPRPRHPYLTALVVGGTTAVALLTLDSQWRLAIVVSVIATAIALSSVVVTGYVGQISLAQYAFAGFAGFTTAKLAGDLDVSFPWAPLLAVTLTAGIGILAGLPAVRVRGLTLALATVGAAVAIEELFFKSPSIGGLAGRRVPRPELLGVDLGFSALGSDNFRPQFGLFALAVVAIACIAVANLRRSVTGLHWLAVRANERAAAAAGINVPATKLLAFAVSSVLAGIGGVLLAYQLPTLSPDAFTVFASLALLALAYLGGIAGISGAVLAGVLAAGGVMTHLSGGESSGSRYQVAISGLLLIVVAVAYPDGIAAAVRRGTRRLRRVRPPTAERIR